MTRIIFLTLMAFVTLSIGVAAHAERTEGIAAIVNDDALSFSDLEDRMDLIISSTGFPNTPEMRERVLPQALGGLIEEQIKMQEANGLGIEVSDQEIAAQFAQVAAQNKVPVEQFKAMLERGNIRVSTLERQMKAQIAWRKVIQTKLHSQVNVTESDVEATLERMKNSIGRESFLVAEIFLPVEEPDQEASMKQLADRLVAQLTEGKAPFYKVAQQFSKAAGAAQGGDMGWVQKEQLPDELAAVVGEIKTGEISPPIRSLTGYHILFVRDKRLLQEENLPSETELYNSLANERLERLQRRHYMDLKATAFIESRV